MLFGIVTKVIWIPTDFSSPRGTSNLYLTVDRFDQLIENVTQDDASPDKAEILKLLNIKNAHISYTPRIFPGHPKWNETISLLAIAHRPNKEGYRLVRDSGTSVSLCQLQGLPDQPWVEEMHQDHGSKL